MNNSFAAVLLALASAAPAMAASSDSAFAQSLQPVRAAVAFTRPAVDPAVIRDQTTTVQVALNAKTVKCSRADYSLPMLKVLVPGLADLTVLNHRNTREGAPCVAAGACGADLAPEKLLQAGEGTQAVPVRVRLKKEARVEDGVCKVTLVETVETTIRGVKFFHERSQEAPDRDPADCR